MRRLTRREFSRLPRRLRGPDVAPRGTKLSWPLVVFAIVFVAGAACVQSTVGFGFALISAPLLVLLSNDLVPGPLLAVSCVLSAATAWREHASIDRRGVTLLLVGRLPGALAGAALLRWLPPAAASVVFAALILLGVLLSAFGFHVARSTRNLLAVGALSGVMGTTTAAGGPPIALIYNDTEGAALRATLNAYFACGAVLSVVVLALSGQFGVNDLLHGAWLLPSVWLGFALSRRVQGMLDRERTRAAVLLVAGACAAVVMVKALWPQ